MTAILTTPHIRDIPLTELRAIKPLWQDLNQIHLADSIYYQDFYRKFTFEKRMAFLNRMNTEDIKISVIQTGEQIQGYCLSTIREGTGEIESLYVDPSLQKQNYGTALVSLHKSWFRQRNCTKIKVTVAFGHDSVMEFYHKQGFYERLIELELKE
jgi:GNAT superfamily N-acetyltransferase